jgi:ParB family transcriptional regulator, chromosome partitioning protein
LGLGGPVPVSPAPEAPPRGPTPGPLKDIDAIPGAASTSNANGAAQSENRDHRKSGLMMVPITSIVANPYQPRKHIDPDVLAELAQSIRENGLIQPPVVSLNPDFDPDYKGSPEDETGPVKKERKARYLLIAGERRWQASKLAGVTEIPVVIKEATPIQMLELALVENIQRADLNPLEEALAYRQLMQEFKLTQEAVAQKVGKSRAAVANSLRLFDLPQQILDAVYANKITEGHARALLMVHRTEDQYRLLHDIIARQFSVRQTEEMARRLNALAATEGHLPAEDKPRLSPAERETRELEDQFMHALGSRVSLSRSTKGGKLVIQFTSDDELETIYTKIVGAEI